MKRFLNCLLPLSTICLLSACGAIPGLGKPDPSPAALQLQQLREQQPRKVALHLHAAPRLNLDAHGQPLALLVRVYTLRQAAAFEGAPYAAFLTPQGERETLGADLVDVRELTLVPGQKLDLEQSVARDAGYVGIVALFHAPAQQGWRLAFAAADAEQAGVTLGLHACSLSVGQGATANGTAPAPLSLVRCQ